MLVSRWVREYGDRRQEMVLIGATAMVETAIGADLNACLVPDTGKTLFDAQEFAHLPDPFPVWQTEPAAQ